MGILDRPSSGLTVADIRRLITLEVQRQTPAIPAGVLALADDDNPLIPPPTSTIQNGQAIIFDQSTGGWQVGSLGVIDGTVTNAQIESVSGSKITAGTLSALLTLTGRLATALTGQRIEIDSGGMRSYDDSGANTVNIPADGSTATFTGDLVTGNLQVNGGLIIDGLTNVMNKGSQLTLNEGQQDPPSAPTIGDLSYANLTTGTYDSSTGPIVSSAPYYQASGHGGVPTWTFVTNGLSGKAAHIQEIKVSDGTLIRSRQVDGTHSKATILGVVTLGSNTYELWATVGGVLKWDTYDEATWTYQSTSASVSYSNISNFGAVVSSDGTDVFVISPDTSTTGVWIVSADPTQSFAQNYSRKLTGGVGVAPGCEVNSAWWDGTYWHIGITFADAGSGHVSTSYAKFDTTTGAAWVSGSGFSFDPTLGTSNASGWDGTALWVFDTGTGSGINRYKFGGIKWTPIGGEKFYVGYTWSDGTHHTKVSPRSTWNPYGPLNVAGNTLYGAPNHPLMGGELPITVPTFPTGATEVDLYLLPSTSTPAATSLKLQAPTTYVDSNSATLFNWLTYNSSGTAATDTNDFGSGTSTIQATFGNGTPWEIGGDGTFQLPVWATADRISAPSAGAVGFNSDLSAFEGYSGSAWGVIGPTVVSETISIGATAAKTAGSMAVTITGLRVGDVVTWAGVTSNSPFIFYTDPVCSTAGQITLRYYNADNGAGHALASQTHTFIIYRQG